MLCNSKRVKNGTVPPVFDFPFYLQKRKPKRKIKSPTERHNDDPESIEIQSTSTKKLKTSSTKDELQVLLRKQKEKIKILQQKAKTIKTGTLSGVIDDLRERSLVDQETAVTLNEKFSGLTLDIIQNQFVLSVQGGHRWHLGPFCVCSIFVISSRSSFISYKFYCHSNCFSVGHIGILRKKVICALNLLCKKVLSYHLCPSCTKHEENIALRTLHDAIPSL